MNSKAQASHAHGLLNTFSIDTHWSLKVRKTARWGGSLTSVAMRFAMRLPALHLSEAAAMATAVNQKRVPSGENEKGAFARQQSAAPADHGILL